jgi:hypothetical protein
VIADDLRDLLRAGFRPTLASGTACFYERPAGPFVLQVIHDRLVETLELRIAIMPAWPAVPQFRDYSITLPTPEAVLKEARTFIDVFESSVAVGGD